MSNVQALPGMERQKIQEVDDAAESYVDARDKRMKLIVKETEAKAALLGVMKKHKLEVYKDESASPPLVVTVVPGEDDVKVKSLKVRGDGEDAGE